MIELAASMGFGLGYFVLLWWAIPHISERVDWRKDGRPGFRIRVAGTIDFDLYHDTEGMI